MDALLKTLAEASMSATAAEEAVVEGAFHTATELLDAAAVNLETLRTAWPSMPVAQRAVVGPSAAETRKRVDAARAKVPRTTALTLGTPVHDPEEESDPAD
jgi:hypothetical protein